METKTPRWINPFILKLGNHSDMIFTCKRGQEQVLSERLAPVINSYKKTYLEICSGSGQHCLQLALQNPETLVIGVELRFKRIVRTAEKADKPGLKNLRLLQTDANCLPSILTASSIDRIYVNFPDPWDGKKHWNKNFLLSKNYLQSLAPILKSAGVLAIKTDHQSRFEELALAVKELNAEYKLVEMSNDLHSSEFQKQNILTEFEGLFISQKKPVFYLKAEKL